MNFYIAIIKYGKIEKIVKILGPMSEKEANKIEPDVDRNLKHEEYYTRIVKDNVRS